MKKIVGILVVLFFELSIILYGNSEVVRADKVAMTELAEYALSWDGHKNIPYVWGGGRNSGETLERLDSIPAVSGHPNGSSCTKKGRCSKCCGTGTDCSGFTSLVYKHFGISISAQSSSQYSEAKKRFKDIKEAVPGDIVWWSGHVGIYLGNNKIIHTNSTDGPTNYPHVSVIAGEGANYKYPTYFLRMVDDVSKLKPMTNKKEAKDAVEKVQSIEGYGSVVTESDLTGMIIFDTLEEGNSGIPEIVELSDEEKVVLEDIKGSIEDRKSSLFDTMKVGVSFLGLCCIFYGVLLGVAYLFDKTNNLFEISLLGILTLGKYVLWDNELGVKPGYHSLDGRMYCNSSIIIKRMVILEVVGFLLVGGIWRFIIFFERVLEQFI